MAEEKNSLLGKLKTGETVICSKCGKGIYVPYNTTAEKAHCFYCSNPECDSRIQWDAVIDIE